MTKDDNISLAARLGEDQWFIVSACKGTPLDEARTQQLKAMLAGLDPIEATGVRQGKQEKSLLIFASEDQALHLGQLFDQEAVLTKSALIDCLTGDRTPVNGIVYGADAEKQNGYTKVGNLVFSTTLG